jgi:hypothetical protein
MLTAFLFGLPILYAVVWIVLLVRNRRAGLFVSLIMCIVTFAAGYWSIWQSRSSTAGLGFLFLPSVAALSGGLTLLFGRLRRHPRRRSQVAAWLCLLAGVGIAARLCVAGIQERTRNRGRDRQEAQDLRAIDENRTKITQIIHEHTGNESAALDAEIKKHATDRTFLLPALETSFVPEDTLDRLASNGDVNVVLWVSRNPRTRSDTLEGKRFQMIRIEGEGQCHVRALGKKYLLTSCPWLEGFGDHQSDIFAVVTATPAKKKL